MKHIEWNTHTAQIIQKVVCVCVCVEGGDGWMDVCIVCVCYICISFHLFSFHGSVQDYKIHMDMEIVIFT